MVSDTRRDPRTLLTAVDDRITERQPGRDSRPRRSRGNVRVFRQYGGVRVH